MYFKPLRIEQQYEDQAMIKQYNIRYSQIRKSKTSTEGTQIIDKHKLSKHHKKQVEKSVFGFQQALLYKIKQQVAQIREKHGLSKKDKQTSRTKTTNKIKRDFK